MPPVSARILGRVETPPRLARALAESTLAGLGESPRVLDPACGPGALLRAAARVAPRARLVGWEKDPEAAGEARAALPGARIATRDALEAPRGGRFDAVLANPPWVSFSGREAVRLPAAAKARLRARFESFRGWPQLQGPFLEVALDVVRPGGRVGFVLPRQVLELERYAAIREVASRRARLLEVRDLGEGAFPGVCEPAATVVLERADGEASAAPWLAGPDLARWARRVLERLGRFPRFPRELVSDPGVHTGNSAARLLRDAPGAGTRPCREGKDVHAYGLAAPRLHVALRPSLPPGHYATVRPEARYRETAVVVRQTADRPIAARHEPWAFFRNSVLAIGRGEVPVEVVLALLNSKAFALAHRAANADARQRAFPQVKVSALARLPWPPVSTAAGERIVGLVRRRERAALPELDRAIEGEVASLLGLDRDARALLLRWDP